MPNISSVAHAKCRFAAVAADGWAGTANHLRGLHPSDPTDVSIGAPQSGGTNR